MSLDSQLFGHFANAENFQNDKFLCQRVLDNSEFFERFNGNDFAVFKRSVKISNVDCENFVSKLIVESTHRNTLNGRKHTAFKRSLVVMTRTRSIAFGAAASVTANAGTGSATNAFAGLVFTNAFIYFCDIHYNDTPRRRSTSCLERTLCKPAIAALTRFIALLVP